MGMQTMKRLVLALLLACALPVWGADKYVRVGGNNGNSGNDWTNAYATIATCETNIGRGDTCWIGDGSVGGLTFNIAVSGSTPVTFKKGTSSSHGTETGWQASYANQAQIGGITCVTQYLVIDGQTRTESNTWTAPTGYGLRASSIGSDTINGENCSNSTFSYIDIGPAYTTTYASGLPTVIRFVYSQTNITLSRCAFHNSVPTGFQGAGADNITIEYCNIGPTWGKQAIRGGNNALSTGWIIRYNKFWRSSQTDPDDGTSGITADVSIWDSGGTHPDGFNDHQIYGNWFWNDQSGGRNSVVNIGGDGGGWIGGRGSNNKIYNNTIVGIPEDSVFPDLLLIGGTGNIIRNNLFYDVISSSASANTTSNNTEVVSNPFVDYANLDLRLSGATTAGFDTGSELAGNDVDALGVTRGADGTWDLGAYEFNAGGPPSAPQNLRILSWLFLGGLGAVLTGGMYALFGRIAGAVRARTVA